MLTRIDHIDLRVPVLADAVAFFTTLGLRQVRAFGPPRQSVEMALPGPDQVLLEIREDPAVTGTTVDHIAFAADDDRAALDALKAAGLSFSREAHLVATTGRRVSNFTDPHGGKWQLTEEYR
ncbi:hypothetical protein Aple_092410 [Acrocarpospora pleiomorpha]|uniref:VOC domain-containing protein n=1 Tax=Acrocarpospora pleiomorpha TaxID=90975 RepID=A0A5M3XZ64_9ACTN|nr:VOC family protein [Acrocarpospora pleiomorpha]GES26342.1 hypothetical protein Aple_092410 [Acrocarpospora pleiomorpha]